MITKQDKILVIAESPNKVKTITSILKKAGYSKAEVVASVGHIMTLKDGGPAFNSGIYPDKQFKMNLAISDDKKKVVESISAHAAKADKILIATDQDREGEVIAWSIVKFCKLPEDKCFRAAFHEITPNAVIRAIENPIPFNNDLVNAGLARMMTDKLIGYGLSPLGKKYIGAKSIGRCQSVGLKLISDREVEINNFIPELYFDLYLNFVKNSTVFRAKYAGYKNETIEHFIKQQDVDAVINDCRTHDYIINDIKIVEHKESPRPPFCTATFQQEAANRFGMRVKDAMGCAQKLFEGININGEHKGLITYMRTDSTEMSTDFMPQLRSYITEVYGANSFIGQPKAKHKATDQDGHEALRVVDPYITPDILAGFINNKSILNIYKLIWQRTIASVMPSAVISETVYTINNNEHTFVFSSKELTKPGYKLAYEYEDNEVSACTELFTTGEVLKEPTLESVKKFTKAKPRYTEASLVKELQKLEVGRPSTYATIVETILSPTRGYAELKEKYIVPTDRGIQLAEYCNRAFPSIISTDYTKEMEISLDKIALGKVQMLDYMKIFYTDLHNIITNTNETGVADDMPKKTCPKCGASMIVRRSRFGKLFYGCTNYPKCNGIISCY